jgi:hypothetical protein
MSAAMAEDTDETMKDINTRSPKHDTDDDNASWTSSDHELFMLSQWPDSQTGVTAGHMNGNNRVNAGDRAQWGTYADVGHDDARWGTYADVEHDDSREDGEAEETDAYMGDVDTEDTNSAWEDTISDEETSSDEDMSSDNSEDDRELLRLFGLADEDPDDASELDFEEVLAAHFAAETQEQLAEAARQEEVSRPREDGPRGLDDVSRSIQAEQAREDVNEDDRDKDSGYEDVPGVASGHAGEEIPLDSEDELERIAADLRAEALLCAATAVIDETDESDDMEGDVSDEEELKAATGPIPFRGRLLKRSLWEDACGAGKDG